MLLVKDFLFWISNPSNSLPELDGKNQLFKSCHGNSIACLQAVKSKTVMAKECEILVDSVCPNPRCICHIQELEDLISSLRQQGQLEPIQVSLEKRTFVILDGEKRWRACKKIGWRKVRVVIYNL